MIAEFVRLPDMPEAERADAVRRIADTALTAVDLGCDLVLIPVRVKPEEPERAESYAEGYAELLTATKQHGTVIAAEFVGGARPADAANLVRVVDDPRARLFFDVGNCLYAGADPVSDLRTLLPLVAQVHLKGARTPARRDAVARAARGGALGRLPGALCPGDRVAQGPPKPAGRGVRTAHVRPLDARARGEHHACRVRPRSSSPSTWRTPSPLPATTQWCGWPNSCGTRA